MRARRTPQVAGQRGLQPGSRVRDYMQRRFTNAMLDVLIFSGPMTRPETNASQHSAGDGLPTFLVHTCEHTCAPKSWQLFCAEVGTRSRGAGKAVAGAGLRGGSRRPRGSSACWGGWKICAQYNTQCAPGAPAVLRGLRFAHIVIYTPNVTLGAHDLPTEDSRAPRSTLGAHDGHMADKGAHFFKSGAHERHLEDSLNERVRSAVYGVLLTFSYKRSSKNLPTYLPRIHIKVRPEDGPPTTKSAEHWKHRKTLLPTPIWRVTSKKGASP